MLFFYAGTDRKKALNAMNAQVSNAVKKAELVRVSDANMFADVQAALAGGGMFSGKRVVVLSGTLSNEEMREAVLQELDEMKRSEDIFFIFEEKVDASTRKSIEKYAESSERFDLPAAKRAGNIFAIANALKRGDKKELWVSYQRELAGNAAPEAIHGVLFWGAKDMFMKSHGASDKKRAEVLVASLAELPHEARRRGEELEYALERFLLSVV